MTSAALRRYALIEVARQPITIGQASKRTGLTPRAIRLYEDHGFIAPARDGNEVRFYDHEIVARLQHIAFFRRAELSLKEIGELLKVLDAGGEAAMRRRLLELLTRRAAVLDRQRREIEQIRQQLLESEAEAVALYA